MSVVNTCAKAAVMFGIKIPEAILCLCHKADLAGKRVCEIIVFKINCR